ncbi:MAG: dihydrofolate reductase family protein, partial [Sphingomonadaceae bacterium]|nr:dihydrofolate reductase family protein [Sphingomonadaceae bacterium]
KAPEGWRALPSPEAVHSMAGIQYLFVEGGAQTAAAFLKAGLVDRLLLYRAPIIVGSGNPGIADIGLATLAQAHGQWQINDRRQLGSDTLEVYRQIACSQE